MKSISPQVLLAGLDAIAASFAQRPSALALLALGSCGADIQRLDAYSDLDFFVIVDEHAKQDFIANLDWLTPDSACIFAHRNTLDGWKTLHENGIFCEFAVFHQGELANIPFAPGRVVWAREGFDVTLLTPVQQVQSLNVDWAVSEALTNILVGLKRYLRGEKLAARQAIGVHAMDHICSVLRVGSQSDPYNAWRRMEVDAPGLGAELAKITALEDVATMARAAIAILIPRGPMPEALLREIERHLDLCDAS